jgi:F-type H+-transporting ATPase subunit b
VRRLALILMTAAPFGVEGVARAAEEGGGGGLPQLDFATWPGQIFWLFVSFLILYVALKRWLLPRLGGIIEDRRDKIADDLDEANRLQRQAQDAKDRYEKGLADARAKAHAIAGDTRDKLAAELADETKAAEAEFAKKAGAAEARIRAATAAALANVKTVAGDAADALVEKLAGVKPSAEAIAAALEAAERG